MNRTKKSITLDKLMKGPPKWTNDALADLMGVTGSYMSQLRHGRPCGFELAKRISSFFKDKITAGQLQEGFPTNRALSSSKK